jgi:hypothetical protein
MKLSENRRRRVILAKLAVAVACFNILRVIGLQAGLIHDISQRDYAISSTIYVLIIIFMYLTLAFMLKGMLWKSGWVALIIFQLMQVILSDRLWNDSLSLVLIQWALLIGCLLIMLKVHSQVIHEKPERKGNGSV